MSKRNDVKFDDGSPLAGLIASGNFADYPPETQDKLIAHDEMNRKREAGCMGWLLGTKNTKVHGAFLMCFGFFFIILLDMAHSYYLGKSADLEFVKTIAPFFMLALGYAVGKDSNE